MFYSIENYEIKFVGIMGGRVAFYLRNKRGTLIECLTSQLTLGLDGVE